VETYKNGAPGIEAADLRALRTADAVSFRFADGAYTITARRDREKTQDGFDQTIVIPCSGRVIDYGDKNWGKTDNEYRHCHECILTPAFDEVWQTSLGFIKPGDMLALHWVVSQNGHTQDHGLYADTLKLVIDRPGKASKRYTFIIRTQVCPDNTARMIRRHLW